MFIKFKILFLLILIFFHYKSLSAQSNDTSGFVIEEIEVFSNKIITDNFNSPTKIQFIDRNKIKNKNGGNLSDVLQLAGGVFVKSYGGNSSLSTLSMNGLGTENTLVLLNGFKLNSSQNAQIDLNTISKDNIDRIEVLNNGSSSLYGSEAIGGVINIVTKETVRNDLTIYFNGQIGSYKQKKLLLNLGKKLKKFSFDLNCSKETSQNNFDYYFNNGLEKILKQRANSDYDILNYFVALNYQQSEKSNMSYMGNYSEIFRSIPGIEAGSAPSNSIQLDKIWNNVLTFEHTFSKHINLKSQVNFQNTLLNYSDRLLINSSYKNIYFSNISQINYFQKNFELVSGYEFSVSSLKSHELDDAGRIQTGLFLVSKIIFSKVLKLFPSLRYDYVSDINKNVISGKFGLNVKPFEKFKLNFKSSIGNNFASPTFNELYWNNLGNKNLKPESSVNFDAGAIVGFNLFSDNTIEVSYTYIDAKDKIVWSPNLNGLWIPKNIGKSTSNVLMIDLNLYKRLFKNLAASLDLKYSYTQSIKKSENFPGDPSYDKQIFYIPIELTKCIVALNFKQTGLNLFYNFIGKRYTDFENINFLPAVDYFEGNIYQNLKINKIKFQLRFEVNNIFNTDYQIISGYPMPLRNYKINFSIEY